MEKNDLRESKKEIPVYRVSSKATRLFFKVIKATSIKTVNKQFAFWFLREQGFPTRLDSTCKSI